MKNEMANKIYNYIKTYANDWESKNYVDYYQFFELDRNLPITRIAEQLKGKKLKPLLSTDLNNYFPESFHRYLEILQNELVKAEYIFDDLNRKTEYDQALKQQEKQMKMNQAEKQYSRQETVTPDNEFKHSEVKFAVEETIKRYGIDSLREGLTKAFQGYYENWFVTMTRINGARAAVQELTLQEFVQCMIEDCTITSTLDDNKTNAMSTIFLTYADKVIKMSELLSKKYEPFKRNSSIMFNEAYNQGNQDIIDWDKNQLKKYVIKHDANAFGQNMRDQLNLSEVSPYDAKALIEMSLIKQTTMNYSQLCHNGTEVNIESYADIKMKNNSKRNSA